MTDTVCRLFWASLTVNHMLFAGNLLRRPAFLKLRQDQSEALRVEEDLLGADVIMVNALFLGTYPGLTEPMLAKEIVVIQNFSRV